MDFMVDQVTVKIYSMKIVDWELFRAVNLMAVTFTLVSCICEYHVYKDIWDPSLGESICCERKDSNPQDPYAAWAVILIYSPRGSLELHHFVTTRNF